MADPIIYLAASEAGTGDASARVSLPPAGAAPLELRVANANEVWVSAAAGALVVEFWTEAPLGAAAPPQGSWRVATLTTDADYATRGPDLPVWPGHTLRIKRHEGAEAA